VSSRSWRNLVREHYPLIVNTGGRWFAADIQKLQ
jgi:hypothetical protein